MITTIIVAIVFVAALVLFNKLCYPESIHIRCSLGWHDHGYRHWTKTYVKNAPVIEVATNQWSSVAILVTERYCDKCGKKEVTEELLSTKG